MIGSSMGGWMALLLAREIAKRGVSGASLAGLVLIAPAPDFTEALMWNGFSPEIRREIETNGVWLRPSQYGEPYPITRALIEEGRNHLLLGSAIDVGCPVRILQGAQDPDVPWQHAFALAHRLPSDDVVLTMIQDGDHRLSRPQDIARIIAAVAEIEGNREERHEHHCHAPHILRRGRTAQRLGIRRAVHARMASTTTSFTARLRAAPGSPR